jgi:hypothetical protein
MNHTSKARTRRAAAENPIALDTANSRKPQTVAINARLIYIQIHQELYTSSVSRVLAHRGMDVARAATDIDIYGELSKPRKQCIALE